MNQKNIAILSISLFVALLVWGFYTFIVYLGIPSHELVYMTQDQLVAVNESCSSTAYWCRGMESIWPFFTRLFAVMRPLWGYGIISLVAYGILISFQGFKTGTFGLRGFIRPIHLIIGFVLSVWLFATVIALGSTSRDGDPKFMLYYEPLPGVYQGIGDEALEELQINHQDLLERGCLREIGTTNVGAKAFNMTFGCMQTAFLARGGLQMILVAILLLNFLVLGRCVLQLMKRPTTSPLLEFGLSFGMGSFAMVIALWLLAVIGLFNPIVLNIFFFGLPFALFPHSLYWLKSSYQRKISIGEKYSHVFAFCVWLLISYIGLNFLNVVRPFPIGWDDLGRYLNVPKLLASYGSFIPNIPGFQWEYISGMTFSLFGIESTVGSNFAMMSHWAAGILALLSVYVFGRLFFGPRGGLIAAILYYFLPMVGHFSFGDMKIDNASFFTSTLGVMAVLAYLFGTPGVTEEEERTVGGDWRMLVLAGALASFTFSIKATGVLTILMQLSILLGASLGAWGFAAGSAFSFVVLQLFAPFNVIDIATKLGYQVQAEYGTVKLISLAFFGALTAIFLVVASLRHRSHIMRTMKSVGIFGASLIACVLPWMAHNVWSNGGYTGVNTVLSYKESRPLITYDQAQDAPSPEERGTPVRALTPELAIDKQHPACIGTTKEEELDRYWGFDTGLDHYLTLPWRSVMNIDAVGYYVTLIPALLLLPLLVLLPFFWKREARWLRLLYAGSMVFLLQWMFVGNGVIWYGLGMFLGFVLALEGLVLKAPDSRNRILMSVLLALSICVSLVNRMWQFDTQRNLFEYALGKTNMEVMREVTIPYYDDIRQDVLDRHATMTDRPYTYRIGTFIPYFIPQNLEILPLGDHQLQFFNCINQERDHAKTLRRLQALGFNSIIFDTNTATIEQDVNGTLHQKVNAFINFLNDPAIGIESVVNDPAAGIVYVRLP